LQSDTCNRNAYAVSRNSPRRLAVASALPAKACRGLRSMRAGALNLGRSLEKQVKLVAFPRFEPTRPAMPAPQCSRFPEGSRRARHEGLIRLPMYAAIASHAWQSRPVSACEMVG
jgi:hypothetical protein